MNRSAGVVSVVIPVKNAVATLGRTLRALQEQTWRQFEVIVVDGGSTDGTLELLAAARIESLRLLSDPHGGITSAVNLGISSSSGEWVMPWMCADDYLDPKFLESVVHRLASDSQIGFVYGNWHAVDRGRVIKSRVPAVDWRAKIRHYMPVVLPNTFVFSRSVFKRLGPLDETLRFSNDYDLLRRVVDADIRGEYSSDAWYYYQVGGLSQKRVLDCQLEIVRSAISHGSSPAAVYAHFARLYAATKASFLLNRIRRMRRGSRHQ